MKNIFILLIIMGTFTFADMNEKICKAAISKIFYKNPQSVSAFKKSDYYIVSYLRTRDNTTFMNKCKVGMTNIVWGSMNGRWRTMPADGKILYKTVGNNLIITEIFSNGSKDSKTYNLKNF